MSTAARIQEAALARFARHGYAAASMTDIAGDSGIKKPSIYTHFKSKQELFHSLLQLSLRRELAFAGRQLQPSGYTAETLRGFLEAIPTRFTDSVHLRFWIQTVCLPPPALDSEISAYKTMYYASLHNLVRHVLEQGGIADEQFTAAYLGIIKGLYADLLHNGTENVYSTLTALWNIFARALES